MTLAKYFALLLLAATAHSASAEWRALLVGVSDYPLLPAGVERTVGARNDVLRLRDVLRQRGFKPEHIKVLADGVSDALSPTRATILQSLDDMAESSAPGDVVFVHFAGHGSLEPGASPKDGPAPTFLPLDVGRWNGNVGAVENAIRQSEMRLRIDRIANRGAFVWAMFDACHAAGLVRRPGAPAAQHRFVEPATLGVPLGAIDRSQAAAEKTDDAPQVLRGLKLNRPPLPRGRGGTVFFYAAQAGESAVELKLPLGSQSSRAHGLFSYLVAQTLQDARPMSYRQLGQAVLAAYAGITAAYSTPVFTGDALDHRVLAQESFPVQQWPLRAGNELSVDAGLLSGLVPGAVLAVLPRATAADDELIGHLRVVSADLGRATLIPDTHAARAAPHRGALAAGQYLRLVHKPPRYALRVTALPQECTIDCAEAAAVQRLRRDGVDGVELQWVESPESADLVVRSRAGRIDLVSPTGTVVATLASPERRRSTPSADSVVDFLAVRLAESLHAFVRSRNLLSLAARQLTEAPSAGMAANLRRMARGRIADEPVSPETTIRVSPGDTVSLTVENQGQVALDVTALYLDAGQGITVLFPKVTGESNRLAPGTSRQIDDLEIKVPPVGLERLMVIGRQATHGAERSDFSFLQQRTLANPTGVPSGDHAAFADAAFANYKRRGLARPAELPRANMAIQVFTLDVRASRNGSAQAKTQEPR